MIKGQNRDTNNIMQGTGFLAKEKAYPVELALFLEEFQTLQPPVGDLSGTSFAEQDPMTLVLSALTWWNSYVEEDKEATREAFLNAALELVKHAKSIGGDALGWPLYHVHQFYPTQGPWLSAIPQGCGLSVLVRAYKLTSEPHFLETAHLVACTLERDILDGGVSTPIGADGIFFAEVAVYPAAHTLHGSVFALLGLHDYGTITDDRHIQQIIQRGERTLHDVFNRFDLGFWTYADLQQHRLSTPAQLAQQVVLLQALTIYRGCSSCAERAVQWQSYQYEAFSRLRYAVAYRRSLVKQALLGQLRKIIIPQLSERNPQAVPFLRVCVPASTYPSQGGVRTFLQRTARIMEDRWQMEYITQRVRPGAEAYVVHQFGKSWMTPWFFPQVWFYVLTGAHKLFSLLRQGANYDLIIAQDGVYSGAFATLVGKLIGVRTICIDHSDLTWYKSRAYHIEKWRYLNERAWPWLLRQFVHLLLLLYWPSLHLLARFTTKEADHLLSPGVFGDDIDEICSDLHVPASKVTRFNVTVDLQKHQELSIAERAAQRASMKIPVDALVIAITVRLEFEKGLDISLESISRISSSLPLDLRKRLLVMIAGDGQLRTWLEKEIQRKGLGQICHVMGQIPSAEIHSLLAVSDISLHTSTRGVCMPAAVLEGMAAGCAVIASAEPLANAHVLAEGRGIVVPAGDVKQTTQALERLLQDHDLREHMGQVARTYIAQYHSAEAFRRVLLRASYWSDLSQILEIEAG